MTTQADVLTLPDDCHSCLVHSITNGVFIKEACASTALDLGGTPEKWRRHYFARFHNEGHRG